MGTADRTQRWSEDTGHLYRAIGEFIVSFEHICHAIQTSLMFLLERAGLKNQRISQLLLAGLTAEPLRTLFQSFVAETQNLSPKENKILVNALDRFKTLTEQRNDIVHSTWFIGWGNEFSTEFTEAYGTKLHKTKRGASPKSLSKKADDFEALTEEARRLAAVFHRLGGCLMGGFSLERNFVVGKDGTVSVPPGTTG